MKNAARIVAINIALLLGIALLAEAIFGGWFGGAQYGTLVVPRNMKRTFDISHLYGGTTSTFVRDEHGLRGKYRDVSTIDILTIGGSTTNELFVSEGATWSDQLAARFAEAGREITVVNAGVDGQSSVGHLKNFELWFPLIENMKARYILAFIGINDRALSASGAMAKQDRMTAPEYRKAKRYLMNNSALYTLFRNVRGMVRARDAKLTHNSSASWKGATWFWAPREIQVDRYPNAHGDVLDAYASRLRALAREIKSFGATPIFVTQAMADYRIKDGQVLGRIQPDGMADTGTFVAQAAHNRVTLAVCKEVKITCLDLSTELEFVDGDHYDDLHTTPQGSAKIGRYLYDQLKDVIQ